MGCVYACVNVLCRRTPGKHYKETRSCAQQSQNVYQDSYG